MREKRIGAEAALRTEMRRLGEALLAEPVEHVRVVVDVEERQMVPVLQRGAEIDGQDTGLVLLSITIILRAMRTRIDRVRLLWESAFRKGKNGSGSTAAIIRICQNVILQETDNTTVQNPSYSTTIVIRLRRSSLPECHYYP